MLKKYFIMAITAIFALVACSEKFDEPGIQPAGFDNVHTLSVGIEAGTYTPAEGETKASMEAVIRVNWTKDDEVSVVNATTKKILGGCLKATGSGVSVTFEGIVTGGITNGDRLYYIYPRLNGNTGETDFAAAGYDVSLAGQTYDGENPGKVSFFGYAEDVAGTGTDPISKKIQFTLVTSYAHLNMANLPAKGFNLSSIDISEINKGFKWSLSNATLTADAYGENEGISVNCSNCKITQAGNAVVRFAIPASAATGSEPRVVTVNKAYTNDKYVKDQLIPSAYYNQLYTSWTNENVNVNSAAGDKTEVTIDNLGSTETAEGILPVSGESSSAFDNSKPTEIKLGGLGTITFNQQASAAIKTNTQNAQSTNVFFKVEDVTETKPVQNANLVYEITMKTVDGNGTEVFSKNNAGAESEATVVIELGQSVESVQSVSLVDDNGNLVSGDVTIDSFSEGKLTFTVVHFSKYAIKYTEKSINAVAKIGDRKYETLTSAVAAAQNGNTIKLLCDCNEGEGIVVPEGKNFTLDFGGHTYKVTKDLAGSTGTKNQCFQLLKGSTLVFQNGTITTSCAKLGINSYSDLIVKDVTIDMSQTSATGQVACLETCNGSISLQGNTSLVAKEGQIAVLALYWPNGGYGDINVELNTTGEVKGLMAYGSYQVPDVSTVAQHSHVAIKNGKYDVTFDMDNLDNYDFKIYGGVFKTSPDTKYLAPNHEVVTNTDSETSASYPWTIGEKPYVAKIGTTGYATFAEAIATVPTDAAEATTITIINNANETFETRGAELKKGQKVILDLNGHKLVGTSTKSGYTQYIYVENGGELTVKDSQTGGAIEYHDGYIENLTSGSGTGGSAITCHGCMTLESGTIENKTPDTMTDDLEGAIDMYTNAWGQAYSPADIVLNINGGVVKSNNANTIRLTSFSAQSYTTSVTVNMNGGEVYGRDGFFIQGVSESYLNTNTLNLNSGKVYGTQAVRVMAWQNHENASESKPVTINISKNVDMKSNYGTQSTKQHWSGGICIDNLSGTYEQLLSYVNIIGGGVCKIGGTIYPTLEAAVAAATPLAQIRLIDNCAETVTVDKNVELFTDDHSFTGKLNPAAGYYTFDKNDISDLGDFSSWYPKGMDYITLAYPSAEVHDIDCSGGNIKFATNILETAYSFNAFDTKITREDTGLTDMDLMTKVLGAPGFSKLYNFDFDFDAFGQAFEELTEPQKKRVNEIISSMLPYLSWIADFEVHFSKNVTAGSLGVSGYYGSYAVSEGGGLGMDIDAPAINVGNTYRMLYDYIGMQIPYAGICLAVRTFDCGAYRNVENVENVAGTTMTVDLCLYNSDSESEVKKIVVGTYDYTFPQANN